MVQAAAVAPQVSLVDVMTIIGLIVSVIGGVLGVFSILVTWNLFQAGNKVNLETLKLLGDVKTSTHATEETSRRYTEPLVGGVISVLKQGMSANVAQSGTQVVENLKSILREHAVPENLADEILRKVSDSYKGLQYRVSTGDLVAPAVARFIRWLGENKKKFEFFGVRHLRETVFRSDPAAQEALQYAIDNELVQLYKQPNPKNPAFPTTACRLNRDHPLVQQILPESHPESPA